MRSTTVLLDGQPFHIREWGPPDARPILFLHGFPEYSGAWEELAAALPDIRAIAPDQRGYGQSWSPHGTDHYAPAALVGDMAALIRQIGAPLVVVGHDWGAAIAYGLAIRQPALVSHLVILNGVHPAPFQRELAAGGAQTRASQYIHWLRREGAAAALAADGYRRLAGFFAEGMDMGWFTPDRAAAYRAEWARPGRLEAMVNWYCASPIRVAEPGRPITGLPDPDPSRLAVPMPHLLIWGERDTALLPATFEGLEAFAPDLEIHRIADADHWLHHQQPGRIAALITDWLARRPA